MLQMYWPKEGIETYGIIQVKLVQEDVMATYTVRTFVIKHLKLAKKNKNATEKTVYQYHYTNWPDHGKCTTSVLGPFSFETNDKNHFSINFQLVVPLGTPDHPLPVLNFVKKSSDANPRDAGPIVVHCSAGKYSMQSISQPQQPRTTY